MFGNKGLFSGVEISIDGQSGIEMPIRFYRSEMILSYFEADLDPLLALMPHAKVHPIRRGNRKSVVVVIQTYCNHASIPPYQSVALAIPVTLGKWPAPSYLPLLFEESWMNKGFYIHREAVTTSDAFEARTEIWGFPEFLADIQTQMVDSQFQETQVTEEERILTLRVKRPQYVKEYPKNIKFYSIKQNIVCESMMHIEAGQDSSRHPGSSMIVFGKHPLGRQFQEMGIGPHSLETRYLLDMKAICPYPTYLD
jgi:hypothetical protein